MSIWDDIQAKKEHNRQLKSDYFDKQFELAGNYSLSKKIGVHSYDDSLGVLELRKGLFLTKRVYVEYKTISGVQVLESDNVVDNRKTTTKHKGTAGRAIVGGMLFSAPGAIVGGLTSKKVSQTTGDVSHNVTYSLRIYLDDEYLPSIEVSYNEDLFNKLEEIIENRNQLIILKKKRLLVDKKLHKLNRLLENGSITKKYYDKLHLKLILQKEDIL